MAVNPLPTLTTASPSSFVATLVEIPSSKAAYASNEEPSSALEAIAFAWAFLASTRETSSFGVVVVITAAIIEFIASIVNLAAESPLLAMHEQQAPAKLED